MAVRGDDTASPLKEGRDAAVAELRGTLGRLETALASVSDAIVWTDEQGRLAWCNRAFERLVGRRRIDLLSAPVTAALPLLKGGAPLSPAAHPGAASGGEQAGDFEFGLQGGRTLALRVVSIPVGEAGGARMLTVQDRTEERALLRDLKRSNRELEEFAYVASHDLKAPLRGISSLAQWLAEDFAGRLGEDGEHKLKLLDRRVKRMHALIENILLYSRLGREKGNPETVDPQALIADIIDGLVLPPGIKINIETPLPTLRIDPARARQIFTNLLNNAVRHMGRDEGTVSISCVGTGARTHFTVRDDGPGIESRHFERIFKLFQTLKPVEETGGTGIGLPIVKKIVELYDGEIRVESEPGNGAAFIFTLPGAFEENPHEMR